MIISIAIIIIKLLLVSMPIAGFKSKPILGRGVQGGARTGFFESHGVQGGARTGFFESQACQGGATT